MEAAMDDGIAIKDEEFWFIFHETIITNLLRKNNDKNKKIPK